MSEAFSRPAGRGSAAAALGLVSLIWGYNWVVMKASLQDASPTDSAAWRFLLGAVALLPVLRWLGRGIGVPRGEWWLAGLLGVMLAANFTGTLWGLKLGGTGKVAVLCYTMPFWTVLFARLFLHERMHARQWGAIALAAAGLVVLVDPLHLGGLAPSLLALLAGCSWGASIVLVKSTQGRIRSDLLTLTFWQMLTCSLLMFAAGHTFGTPPVHWTPLFLATLLYMSVLASAAAWMLFYFALKRLPAGIASMGTLATPVLGVAGAWLQYGERPTAAEGAGMALICVGLLLLALPPELLGRPARQLQPPGS